MLRRILLFGPALFLAIALLGAGLLFWAAKRAEPPYSGELTVEGLSAPVTVRYGPYGVPSVEAQNLADLLFAQGYLVASERMWQMDLMRRLASGRLAEVLGEEALPADRLFRTIGLQRAAQTAWDDLDEPYRDHLEAFAAGVNAYRARAVTRPPLEYLIAGLESAPWEPLDTLAIGQYMAWTLSFNVREELVFLRMAARVGNEQALELFPTDEGVPAPDYARELPAFTADLSGALQRIIELPARYGLPVPGAASNAWAVNGERTQDGRSLLANDPHLAPSAPGIWYELELRSPQLHVAGFALPGVPFVVIGHNEHLAWGFTTVMADTQDLFVERPTAADPTRVERPDGLPEPIVSRTEEIPVKGRERPATLVVRSTRHGVILNDVLGTSTGTEMDLPEVHTAGLLALRTNFEVPDRGVAALHGLATARTLDEARAAGRNMLHASQNLMLAHRDGDIAWQVTGVLPLRGRGLGTFPAPGWESGWGWTGYVPPEQNPTLENPPGYALLTANNRTVPLNYEVNLGRAWQSPYRARRIEELLAVRDPLTAEYLERMQLDLTSRQALMFKEALARAAPEIRDIDPRARRIADEYLMAWGGDFAPDSRAAALFALLKGELYRALFGDELGEKDLQALMSVAIVSFSALEQALYTGESSFWDDVRTAEVEGRAHVWARALRAAKEALDRRQPELGEQRLDRLRHVRFPHAFDRLPILGDLFGVGPFPIGGDTHTVNSMKAPPHAPEQPLFVPSLRVVFTPADWGASRATLTLGQSGHRFSPHRTDQLDHWLAGETRPLIWNGPTPDTELGALVLRPAGG